MGGFYKNTFNAYNFLLLYVQFSLLRGHHREACGGGYVQL
jgi:hypothetical protein